LFIFKGYLLDFRELYAIKENKHIKIIEIEISVKSVKVIIVKVLN